MKLDLATAYAASFARVASWAIVAGVVYRRGGPIELSLLMLARGTVGFLTYASVGLTPTLIARFTAPRPVLPIEALSASSTLDYAAPAVAQAAGPDARRMLYESSVVVVFLIALAALGVAAVYAASFWSVHDVSKMQAERGGSIAMLLAVGVAMRAWSDVPSAWLAATGRLPLDNLIVIMGDVSFALLAFVIAHGHHPAVEAAGMFAVASLFVALARFSAAGIQSTGQPIGRQLATTLPIIASGLLVLLSQMADWLYAPFNQILISRELGAATVANYVPAIQIDGAMLLIVSGLSVVLLPKTAIAHASNDLKTIRTYYVRGTLFSLLALVACAFAVIALDETIFKLWFNDPMPATQAILPLVLIHTVIGGTASIGRSVLFGIGRIKAYAIAAVLGGLANVALAIVFVTQTQLGLRGIVLATVITVTIRCALWMPWYTLHALREPATSSSPSGGI